MTDATMIDQQPTTTDATTDLAQAIGFSEDDLAANRAGRLSEMQVYRLKVRQRRLIAVGVLVLLLTTFAAALMIFAGGPILTLLGIGVTICNAAVMSVLARHWMRLSADLRHGEIHTASGTLERVIKPINRRVINYMIRVDDAEVMVSKPVFEQFAHEQPYTLYLAPVTGTLLSAERLS